MRRPAGLAKHKIPRFSGDAGIPTGIAGRPLQPPVPMIGRRIQSRHLRHRHAPQASLGRQLTQHHRAGHRIEKRIMPIQGGTQCPHRPFHTEGGDDTRQRMVRQAGQQGTTDRQCVDPWPEPVERKCPQEAPFRSCPVCEHHGPLHALPELRPKGAHFRSVRRLRIADSMNLPRGARDRARWPDETAEKFPWPLPATTPDDNAHLNRFLCSSRSRSATFKIQRRPVGLKEGCILRPHLTSRPPAACRGSSARWPPQSAAVSRSSPSRCTHP